MELQRTAALNDKKTRVKVFTLSGEQIGIAGVGEGDKRLTFPRYWKVGDALGKTWLRFATENELKLDKTWWRKSEVQPQSLIHCGKDGEGFVATPEQEMGRLGDRMQALPKQEATPSTEIL